MSDHTQSLEIAAELAQSVQKLQDLADKVGEARQVKEFASDRRKNLLARHMKGYLEAGDSAAKAEYFARTNEYFLRDMSQLEAQQLQAEQIIARYDSAKCLYEARRSLLSHSKHIQDDLQG